MLRETRYLYLRLSALADLALCAAAFVLAHWLRNSLIAPLSGGHVSVSQMRYYLPLLWWLPPLAVGFWAINDLYRFEWLFERRRLWRALALGALEALGALAAIRLLLSEPRIDPYTNEIIRESRAQLILVPLVGAALVGARLALTRQWFERARRHGEAFREVLVVGAGPSLRRFMGRMADEPLWGLRVVAIVDEADEPSEPSVGQTPVVAGLGGLGEVLQARPVDDVIFVPGRRGLDALTPALAVCEQMGVRSRLWLDVFQRHIERTQLDRVGDTVIVTYETAPGLGVAMMLKWTIDRLGAAALLLLFAPLMAAIAVAIRRQGPPGAPILFRQTRVGLSGRRFTLHKFRSMRPGAEAQWQALRARSDVDGPRFKMKDDPRVTPVGRWLRKYSLDELPQLWDVLRGQMSLVGPRPPLPAEVERYTRAQRRRLSMRPGMTCLWAVRGRDRLDWEQWMAADLEYIDRWSLWLDLIILARTFWVVVCAKNAS